VGALLSLLSQTETSSVTGHCP